MLRYLAGCVDKLVCVTMPSCISLTPPAGKKTHPCDMIVYVMKVPLFVQYDAEDAALTYHAVFEVNLATMVLFDDAFGER